MDPTFIVAISFVVFIGIAYRLGYHQSMTVLDQKIANIRQALDDAEKAKEDAMIALANERKHQREIKEEIDLIAKRTEEQVFILRKEALQDIEKKIKDRQKAAERMIHLLQGSAVQMIQDEATEKTLASFEALAQKFKPSQHKVLNDAAISQIIDQLTKNEAKTAPGTRRVRPKRSLAR